LQNQDLLCQKGLAIRRYCSNGGSDVENIVPIDPIGTG
jgi:hypothetical protein